VLQGNAVYPGINAMDSFEFTDLAGISPAVATMNIFPQYGLPLADGDIVLTYSDGSNSYTITLANMHVDAASFVRGQGGQIVRVRFLDERWKWAFGAISGRYNIKLVKCYDAAFAQGAATEFVDPDHEKTPQQLAKLLYAAMGYADSQWDVTVLQSGTRGNARPETDWDYSNPAQELAKLCDDLGCRIVPVRSTGTWKVVILGEGPELPDNYPYQDPAEGIDPVEAPLWLRIVTAPILCGSRLALEAVGKDLDQHYDLLGNLSYVPILTDNAGLTRQTFDYSDLTFTDISNIRQQQPDESLISPRECAVQSVLKTFKIKYATAAIESPDSEDASIPGIDDRIQIKQLILTDTRVEPFIVAGSTTAQSLPAFVEGVFCSNLKPIDSVNYPLGSRIDLAAKSEAFKDDVDDTFGFSIQKSEDARFTLITFNRPAFQIGTLPQLQGVAGTFLSQMIPATLFLHTAVQVRDRVTWQPMRDWRTRYIGTGPEPTSGPDAVGARVLAIIKSDIQPWFRGIYQLDGTLTDTLDNEEAVTNQCNYYLDAIQATFETVDNATRTYNGLFPIDMSGTIQQVTYIIGPGGSDTIASKNTEHDFDIPGYAARRARDSRKGQVLKEIRSQEIINDLRSKGLVQ